VPGRRAITEAFFWTNWLAALSSGLLPPALSHEGRYGIAPDLFRPFSQVFNGGRAPFPMARRGTA